ncbi:MAG: hypothetical protein R8F63_12120 [Acidimicrobiales bacterium]|nr:hypothetical protein [Acidimicrobiales bacterium]
MASRTNVRVASLLGLILLALVAAGCSQSSDPTTWEEALDEKNVEQNFVNACVEADDGATDEGPLTDYCECSFVELQETFADDFGRFDAVDGALRSTPEAIADPTLITDVDTRADVALAAGVIQGCAADHLG